MMKFKKMTLNFGKLNGHTKACQRTDPLASLSLHPEKT